MFLKVEKLFLEKKIQKYKGSEKPVAVIFSTDGAYSETGEKRILAVSLYSSAEKYSFENYNVDITLENVRHNAIDVVNQKFNESTGCYENDGFIGSHDGRNLFYNFTKAQKDNIGAYSDRFPAWKEAGEYGTNHNLKNSGTAWYLPSASELYKLFLNRNEVNKTLKLIEGCDEINDQVFWSASVTYMNSGNVFSVDMKTGELSGHEKESDFFVRSIFCLSEMKQGLNSKYNLGDIVLDDGSILSPAQMKDYKGESVPVAVIFSLRGAHFEESDRVLGVGLDYLEETFFADKNTTGYNTNFLPNQCVVINQRYEIYDSLHKNSGFTGDLDGRNNSYNVKQMDKVGATNFAQNYPALDFAENYGKNHDFKKYRDGWYLPTAAELYELAEYVDIVFESLSVCGKEDFAAACWSSSQDYYSMQNGYSVRLLDGKVMLTSKENELSSCAVYCFEE